MTHVDHPAVHAGAEALAAACPTPDQCAPTHDEGMRRFPVHWLGLGPRGIGEQSITCIEGHPLGVAAAVAPAVLRWAAEQLRDRPGVVKHFDANRLDVWADEIEGDGHAR